MIDSRRCRVGDRVLVLYSDDPRVQGLVSTIVEEYNGSPTYQSDGALTPGSASLDWGIDTSEVDFAGVPEDLDTSVCFFRDADLLPLRGNPDGQEKPIGEKFEQPA